MDAGQPITHLFILVEGMLRVYSMNENGKMGTIAYSYPPQMLGDIEYIQDADSLHNVVAETTAILIRIPISDVKRHLSNTISFYRFICRNLILKLYKTSDDYSKSLLYSARDRLAQYLIISCEGKDVFKFSANSAAEYLGITQRHMSRIITDLVQDNVIERVRPKKLRILDRQYLKLLSESIRAQ